MTATFLSLTLALLVAQNAKAGGAPARPRNRLANESSPYLRLHADNPVDWHPWGPEALALAKKLDRPILLSIGYSACHWCHVMNRESFADPVMAKRLNAEFVCIKVDREERPDIDSLYMEAVRAMTGQGGWPLTAFLLPDGRPFAGGTYFPPVDRKDEAGKLLMPSFANVVGQVLAVYRDRRKDVEDFAAKISSHLKTANRTPRAVNGTATRQTIDEALAELPKRFDAVHGGIASPPRFAPKFPQPSIGIFAFATAKSPDDPAVRAVVKQAEEMALGGIFDQLGGGWHRYSTDREWIVPHFEKMLYDQGQMLSLLAHLEQRRPHPMWRHAAELTAEFLEREMRAPNGLFFAAIDADSEHEEGKFYVWSEAELDRTLGADAAPFRRLARADGAATFEQNHILRLSREYFEAPNPKVAQQQRALWQRGRRQLLLERDKRVRPRTDEKLIAAWNGIAIAALAEAGDRFANDRMKALAKVAADGALQALIDRHGKLARHAIAGKSQGRGFADDHAAMVLGLLAVHRLEPKPAWKAAAINLGQTLRADFWDAKEKRLLPAGKNHESLLANVPDNYDGALPSATSLAALAFVALHQATADARFAGYATEVIESESANLLQAPLAATSLLLALHRLQSPMAAK